MQAVKAVKAAGCGKAQHPEAVGEARPGFRWFLEVRHRRPSRGIGFEGLDGVVDHGNNMGRCACNVE